MPLYTFVCTDCNAQSEIMASMEEKKKMRSEKFICEKCGSKNIEYILDFAGYGGDKSFCHSSYESCSMGEGAPPCSSGKCPFA
jgi:putative FmdB family regulatory protein